MQGYVLGRLLMYLNQMQKLCRDFKCHLQTERKVLRYCPSRICITAASQDVSSNGTKVMWKRGELKRKQVGTSAPQVGSGAGGHPSERYHQRTHLSLKSTRKNIEFVD